MVLMRAVDLVASTVSLLVELTGIMMAYMMVGSTVLMMVERMVAEMADMMADMMAGMMVVVRVDKKEVSMVALSVSS